MASGIESRRIQDTPIAILDFETTGLTPGYDRVVEVCVVRREPGGDPEVVLDTLVNPLRPVAATEIHGISDEDVAQAPTFQQIAGDLVAAVSGCAIAAYNVYFDMKFLASELQGVGVHCEPPHFCLMYMRPMLGLGKRCRLEDACQEHNIEYEIAHIAAQDVQASAQLLEFYLSVLEERGIRTFAEVASLKSYKFTKSFSKDPLAGPAEFNLSRGGTKLLSRSVSPAPQAIDDTKHRVQEYWDALRTVVADLEVTDEEVEYVVQERKRLGLPKERLRVMHARAFASVISQFIGDQWLDDREVLKLRRLRQCLSKLGWAPGD